MFLLMHRKTRPTGKRIAAALGIPARFKTPIRGDTIALRWGTAEHATLPATIQPSDAIARAGNKLAAFQCFQRDGVPCPEFSTYPPTTGDSVVYDTWFGRRTHGMCGTDIKVYRPGDAWVPGAQDFFTKFIPNRREYRVHVFRDQVIGVMGKYLDYPDQAGDGFIKNVAHGYRFRTPAKELKPSRTDAAIAAVKALGLDFGAVDLIIGDDDKEYILEVNTAPALAPLTFAKYIECFKRELGLA